MTHDISAAFFDLDAASSTRLHDDLKSLVRNHSSAHPRSAQRTLGPSEVGHPCMRKMVQSLLFGSGQTSNGIPINPPGDPLPSYIGTAAHARIEQAVEQDNARLEAQGLPPRWLSERKVVVREDLSGTCDLMDLETGTVIDAKFPGTTAMNTYKRNGPSPEYRTQAHLYGAGYRKEGFTVNKVAIWFLPRAGQLSSSHLWVEDYNQDVVDEVLERIDMAHSIIRNLDIETYTKRLRFVPTTPHNCSWCPYWTPIENLDPTACNGD